MTSCAKLLLSTYARYLITIPLFGAHALNTLLISWRVCSIISQNEFHRFPHFHMLKGLRFWIWKLWSLDDSVFSFFYYKVFNRLTPFDPNQVFTLYSPPICLRANLPTLVKPAKLPNKTLYYILQEYIDAWNFLPIDIQLSSSLSSFKHFVKNVDLSSF